MGRALLTSRQLVSQNLVGRAQMARNFRLFLLLCGESRDEFLRNDDRAYVAKRETFDDIERRLVSRFKSP